MPAHNSGAFRAEIAGKPCFFCCPACKAVAETIQHAGLGQYYHQRDDKPQQPASIATLSQAKDFADMDIADNISQFVHINASGICEARLFIPDIHCASCCWLIEQHLSHLPGIQHAQSQLDNHKLCVRWQHGALQPSAIFAALAQIGYRAQPWQPTQQQQHTKQQQQALLRQFGVAGILAMQIHMIAMGDYFGADNATQRWLNAVALLLSLPVWFYCATPFFTNAWRNTRNFFRGLLSGSRELLTAGMDIPVALAIIAAATASILAVIRQTEDLYFDSIAMFVFLLLGARYLEARARARLAAQAQEPQLPHSCTRMAADGQQERIATRALQIGDRVAVESGVVPVDGIVLEGSATVEQSAITGEFLPVEKSVGDQVIAGTVLLQGSLLLRATAWDENSHIAGLHRRMESALVRKAARSVYDHVAQWFTPLVLLTACSSALFWWWRDPAIALPAFLAVLVASCPCALSLAIPAALTAATLQLRKQGILITGGHVLHAWPQVNAIAFDKTGTLTQGRMQVLHTHLLSDMSASDCLAVAAALEQHSNHPVGSAFTSTEHTSLTATNVENALHCGVAGTVDGIPYRIGKASWCTNETPLSGNNDELTVMLSRDNRPVATFTLGDALRDDAVECIRQLQQHAIHCSILSGDHTQAVEQIAMQLGIKDLHRDCSPANKVVQIEAMKKIYGTVAMVGDGINDGPVLAHADVSVALAEASHTAQLAADVLLLNNRLSDLFTLKEMSLRTRRIARQNLAWALIYNISILPLAAAGLLPPVLAALGMAISSLLVTLNALRLFSATAH